MKNLLGVTFGRLTVIEYVGKHQKHVLWKCQCSCGAIRTVFRGNLTSGSTVSCGCHSMEQLVQRSSTHGMTNSRAYSVWHAMKDRCLNPSSDNYQDYGGRGITVCPRWMSFENFYADMGDPPANRTLDRHDNSLGYSPENCRWATTQQQNTNKRNTRKVTFNGKTLCIAEWERELGYRSSVIQQRIRRGWPPEKAVSEPLKHRR